MSFRLADAIFWIGVACCSIAQVAIIRSVVISPARPADSGAPTSPLRRTAEIAGAVIPGIALGVVLVFTWGAMHAARAVAP